MFFISLLFNSTDKKSTWVLIKKYLEEKKTNFNRQFSSDLQVTFSIQCLCETFCGIWKRMKNWIFSICKKLYPSHLPNPASYLFTLNEFKLNYFYSNRLNTGLKKPIYGPKCLIFKWLRNLCDLTILIPDTHSVRYSDVQYSDGYFMLLWNYFLLDDS